MRGSELFGRGFTDIRNGQGMNPTRERGSLRALKGIKKIVATHDALTEWQLAMATAVLAMLPPVAVVIFMQKLFVKGLIETEK